MPYPTSGTTPAALTKAAIQSIQTDPTKFGFVGLQVLQLFNTPNISDTGIPVFSVDNWLKGVDVTRAPDGTYPRLRFATGTFDYSCKEKGLEGPLDDATVRMYSDYFDAEAVVGRYTLLHLLMEQEKRIVTLLHATGTFTNAAATAVWSSAANGVPQADITAAKKSRHLATGFEPNAMVINSEQYDAICGTNEVRNRVVYNVVPQGYVARLPLPVVAGALGLEYLFVAKGIKDTAGEGVTASTAALWDRTKAFVFYHEPDPGRNNLMTPCVGRTMLWTKDTPENELVETYREDKVRGNIVRVRQYTHEVVINSALGYIITGVLA